MILREAEASVWSVVALCESLDLIIWPRCHRVTLEDLLMALPLWLWEVLCVIPHKVLLKLKGVDKEDGVRLKGMSWKQQHLVVLIPSY